MRVGVVMAEGAVSSSMWIVENLCASQYQRQRRAVLDMLVEGPLAKPAIARRLKIRKRELDHLLASIVEEGIVVPLPRTTNGLAYYTLRNIKEAEAHEDLANQVFADEGSESNVIPLRARGER